MIATIKTSSRNKRRQWFLETPEGLPINLVSYSSHQEAHDAATALGYTVLTKDKPTKPTSLAKVSALMGKMLVKPRGVK